jgi:hypothetical protein
MFRLKRKSNSGGYMKKLQTLFASLTAPINFYRMRKYAKPHAKRKEQKELLSARATIYICLLIISATASLVVVQRALAAQVTIDSTPSGTDSSHNGSSPTTVFISDQTAYTFYRDGGGNCVYSKTTNGGTTWGSAVTVDAQTDCIKIAVWYDRWTPGDNTGTNIHIATIDSGSSDVFYTKLNTSGDTLTATVNATGANQGGTFDVQQNIPSITKGTDGDLYMGVQDDADSFVIKCTSTCDNAANWAEAGTNPFDLTDDWLILMPLSSGNIMAIRWDTSASDVQSKVYNDALNTWDVAWTNIDANAPVNLTYDAPFGATVNKTTNTIYLAYAADVNTLGTNDDIRTASYNGALWTSKTDVITNDTRGITGVKIATKENTDTVYVLYTAQPTAGSSQPANVYYKRSTDAMQTWGTEQGPLNTTAVDIYGARMNIISDERIYATWYDGTNADLLGNTVADLTATAVETTAFTAKSSSNGTLLEWRTGYEVDNLGFNIYRETNGKRVRVNPSLIAGSAFLVGQGTAMTAGDSYAWFDPEGTSDSVYYLEDIDLSGRGTLHDPVVPVISNSGSNRPGLKQARTVNELSSQSAATDGPSAWQHGWPAETGDGRELLYKIDGKSAARLQQLIASQQAAKILVKKEGWYRVTQADLAAAGFNTKVDARFLQLFSGGVEVPMLVNASKSGQFSPGDSIEFYGTGLDTPSSDTNTYWLVAGDGKGLRITPQPRQQTSPAQNASSGKATLTQSATSSPVQGDASRRVQVLSTAAPTSKQSAQPTAQPILVITPTSIIPNRAPTVTLTAQPKSEEQLRDSSATQENAQSASVPAPQKKSGKGKGRARRPRRKPSSLNHARRMMSAAQSYPYTVELKERLVYVSSILNGDDENFYGQVVGSAAANENLFLENLSQTTGGTALLEISLQGYTLAAHQVRVKVNGQEVGNLSFANQEHPTAQFNVPASLLREGANTVTLERTGGSSDFSLVDWVRLTYEHGYRADSSALYFTGQGNTRIDGFTNESVRVMDISDPMRVREVPVTVEAVTGGGFAATVRAPGAGNFLAFTEPQVQRPFAIELDNPSTLKTSGKSADLVIIAYGGFSGSVAPLAKLRREQGLEVLVVDVQDVYDEFSYGAHSPNAIRDFLSWARSRWQKAPASVLLVGDASLDPRDYLSKGQTDFVPTKLIDTSSMETASDDWLVDFNKDGLPEMAVGRLPVNSASEADRVVAKIAGYKPGASLQQVLMVIDRNNSSDGFSFAQAGHDAGALLPPSLTVNTIDRASGTDAAVHSQIVDAINQGPLVVNYIGHGSVEVWTGAPILSTTDTGALSNSNHLPVFVMMTCLNGYYQNSARESLAESLLRDNSSGAVAVWASSGMTEPASQSELNQQFYRLLFGKEGMTLGEAAGKAKESITDTDVRRTWILFGDPTMKLQ